MKWFGLLLSLGLYLLGFAWFVNTRTQASTPIQPQVAGVRTEVSSTSLQADVLSKINSERQLVGAPLLVFDPLIQTVAEQRADDMASRRYYAHKDPDGRLFFDYPGATSLKTAEFSCENLVLLTTIDPNEVVHQWLSSKDGHRECLLDPRTSSVGVAQTEFLADTNSQSYVTVFIASSPQ